MAEFQGGVSPTLTVKKERYNPNAEKTANVSEGSSSVKLTKNEIIQLIRFWNTRMEKEVDRMQDIQSMGGESCESEKWRLSNFLATSVYYYKRPQSQTSDNINGSKESFVGVCIRPYIIDDRTGLLKYASAKLEGVSFTSVEFRKLVEICRVIVPTVSSLRM